MIIIIIVIFINFVRDDISCCFSPESGCSGAKKRPANLRGFIVSKGWGSEKLPLLFFSGAAEHLLEMRFQTFDIGLNRRILDDVIAHKGRERLETDELVRLMETEESGVNPLPFKELILRKERVQRRIPGGADHVVTLQDRKSTRLNSSHQPQSRMPSSA